jgi:hypothetical protein
MTNHRDKEEIRWQVVKAMIDEFPTLRKKSQKLRQNSRKLINAQIFQIRAFTF